MDFASELKDLGDHGFALAVQMLRNRDDAADAVQDAFHSAWRNQDSFDESRGVLKAWFLKIVRNRCLDLLRRRGNNSPNSNSTNSDLFDPVDESATEPSHSLAEQETLALVRTELMAMPEDQRELVLLRDYHGLRYSEIADVLSIPIGTVMSRLHRARLKLRDRIEHHTQR